MSDTSSSAASSASEAKAANFSPAIRVRDVVLALRAASASQNTVDAWAGVLGIPAGPQRNATVMRGLLDYLDQVDRMFAAIDQSGQSDSYSGLRPALEAIAIGVPLQTTFAGVVDNLSPEVLRAVRIAATSLRCDEVRIPADEVERLINEASEFLVALPDLGFSTTLRSAIARAVSHLIDSLRRYPIVGARALADIDQQLAGLLIQHRDEVVEAGAADKGANSGARRFVRLCAKVGKAVTSARNAVENADFVQSAVGRLLSWEPVQALLEMMSEQPPPE